MDTDGIVKNVVVEASQNEAFAKEAVRVLQSSPKWKPGLADGKPTKIKLKINLDFNP